MKTASEKLPVPTPVRTGIEGLDAILHGGIPRKNVILVKGAAGAGKTLLGIKFIYRGIVQFDEPGIVVVFETSPEKLIRDAANFGWDLPQLQTDKKLQIIFTSPEVLDQELRSPDSLLLESAIEMGAQRIFIDGIGLLRQSAPAGSASPKDGGGSYRELLQQLTEGLDRENLTALLSYESGGISDSSYSMEAATFLADTVLELKRSRSNRRIHRTIEIVKSRGQNYDDGEHTLSIVDGQGLQVFRRVQSPVPRNLVQPSSMARRSVIGVDALDTLIGGGIFEGSVTMVIGISGVGKTILGSQLLIEGANHGQPGLLVSLDEHPAQIERNAATLGLDLGRYVESGDIQILFESPQELNVDMHFDQITKAVDKHHTKRMVIDGMTSYSSALADHSIYRDFMHALVAFSKQRMLTTFLNYENPEFLGISSYMPDFPVSSIVDNIILLSLVEFGSSLRRCITVVKARGSQHEFDSREFVIGKGGITLLPKNETLAAAAPFSHHSSILSRAPTRQPTAGAPETPPPERNERRRRAGPYSGHPRARRLERRDSVHEGAPRRAPRSRRVGTRARRLRANHQSRGRAHRRARLAARHLP